MTYERTLEQLIDEVQKNLDDVADINVKLYEVPEQPLTYEERRRLRENTAMMQGALWFFRSQLNREREAKKWYQLRK